MYGSLTAQYSTIQPRDSGVLLYRAISFPPNSCCCLFVHHLHSCSYLHCFPFFSFLSFFILSFLHSFLYQTAGTLYFFPLPFFLLRVLLKRSCLHPLFFDKLPSLSFFYFINLYVNAVRTPSVQYSAYLRHEQTTSPSHDTYIYTGKYPLDLEFDTPNFTALQHFFLFLSLRSYLSSVPYPRYLPSAFCSFLFLLKWID